VRARRGVRRVVRARRGVRREGQRGQGAERAHLARVRVDDAYVALALGADQHNLLHVLAADVEIVLAEVLLAYLVEELAHPVQQLL